MKTKNLIVVIMLAVIASCAKVEKQKIDTTNNLAVSKMKDIKVPEGFTWETSKNLSVNVSVEGGQDFNFIAIYTANPAEGGQLIAKGVATTANPYIANISAAKTIENLYVQKTTVDQNIIGKLVKIEGNNISVKFSIANSNRFLGKGGPDCSTGCSVTVNNPSGNLTYSSGNTVCLTGNISIAKLTISGATTVRICGTGSIGNLKFNNTTSKLIVTTTGVINFTATTPIDGIFENYGTISTSPNKNFNVNSNAVFTNNGVADFGKDFNPNGSSVIVNYGTIEVDNKLINSSGCDFTNYCMLIVKDDFQNNGLFKNYGYVKCYQETTIQGGSNNEFKQYSGAMISTRDIQVNGTITGIGTTSLIKVTNNSKGNSQGLINGSQQFCDINGIEGPWNSTINGGAVQACGLNVPTTSCNPEGNANTSTPPADTDGDGVPDTIDEYPNDPTAAFNSYYPSKNGYATVAFEDLWPNTGDYDMNDVVINYNYKIVTNATNNVVRVNAKYSLLATGGSFNNGFAVQFPVERSKISNVTGGTLEVGQSKAVLVLFTNMRAEMNNWNTRLGETKSPNVDFELNFNINNGPTLSTFGLNEYNPFIWNGSAGFGRGYEIHLPYHLPTDLVNANLFSTEDDNTNLGLNRTYVSKNGGFPWAINIPVSFEYPIEKVDINTAYNKFGNWVQSGGTLFNDWYSNTGVGYRTSSNIYQ
jgi:LruC domain-containing protein